MQSSFCLYLMHHENGNAGLNKRGPERSVDIEFSSPDQRLKKRTIPIWYRSFFKRETGIEPATPSLARRCSTAEPLAHVLQTSYNIL